MTWRFLLGGVTVAFLGISLAVLFLPQLADVRKMIRPPIANLPADSDVAKLTAALQASDLGFKAIPEFVVPPQHIPRVLFWLRPSQYVGHVEQNSFPPRDLLGELKITTKAGEVISVKFYHTGHNPPAFTTDGIQYFWGGGLTEDNGHAVDGAIRMGKAIVLAHSESAKTDK